MLQQQNQLKLVLSRFLTRLKTLDTQLTSNTREALTAPHRRAKGPGHDWHLRARTLSEVTVPLPGMSSAETF